MKNVLKLIAVATVLSTHAIPVQAIVQKTLHSQSPVTDSKMTQTVQERLDPTVSTEQVPDANLKTLSTDMENQIEPAPSFLNYNFDFSSGEASA
ncbi:MAG: hypothetical protein AAGG02_19750 [Cyanobacteria bacterium P01_H01_bin.15]